MADIKVFKTNVTNRDEARKIRAMIQRRYPGSRATFDLDDCDRVLRIEYPRGFIDLSILKQIIGRFGYQLEKLP